MSFFKPGAPWLRKAQETRLSPIILALFIQFSVLHDNVFVAF